MKSTKLPQTVCSTAELDTNSRIASGRGSVSAQEQQPHTKQRLSKSAKEKLPNPKSRKQTTPDGSSKKKTKQPKHGEHETQPQITRSKEETKETASTSQTRKRSCEAIPKSAVRSKKAKTGKSPKGAQKEPTEIHRKHIHPKTPENKSTERLAPPSIKAKRRKKSGARKQTPKPCVSDKNKESDESDDSLKALEINRRQQTQEESVVFHWPEDAEEEEKTIPRKKQKKRKLGGPVSRLHTKKRHTGSSRSYDSSSFPGVVSASSPHLYDSPDSPATSFDGAYGDTRVGQNDMDEMQISDGSEGEMIAIANSLETSPVAYTRRLWKPKKRTRREEIADSQKLILGVLFEILEELKRIRPALTGEF